MRPRWRHRGVCTWVAVPWERISTFWRGVGATFTTGIWALLDQAVVSLGMFLAGISLARSLDPSEYGVYALVLGMILSLNGIHTALITYPVSVRGPAMSSTQLESYAGMATIWTAMLSLPLAILVSIPVYLISSSSVVPATALLLVTWQLQETSRRALMSHLRHRDALLGDLVRYAGFVLITWMLILTSQITLNRALLGFAMMSVIAAMIQMRQLGIRFDRDSRMSAFAIGAWKTGKWVLAIMVLTFFTVTAFPWALAVVQDTEVAARYQSLIVVLGVVHPVLFSVSNVIVPNVARAYSEKGTSGAVAVAKSYGVQGAFVVIPYLLIVAMFAQQILHIFFGSTSVYADLSTELRVMAIAYCFIYLTQVIGGLLAGLELTFRAFVTQLTGSIAAVVLGMPLIIVFGLLGACIGQVLIYMLQSVIGLVSTARVRKQAS